MQTQVAPPGWVVSGGALVPFAELVAWGAAAGVPREGHSEGGVLISRGLEGGPRLQIREMQQWGGCPSLGDTCSAPPH